MDYKEINRREDITITTTVELIINDEKLIVDVPHFNPKSESDIIKGIENRYVTEKNKLEVKE